MKLNFFQRSQFSITEFANLGFRANLSFSGALRLIMLIFFAVSPLTGWAQSPEEESDEGNEYHGQVLSRGGAGLDEAGETDNGIGEDELGFSSAESRTLFQRFASSGLGLSLPWQVVHAEVGMWNAGGQQGRSLFIGTGKFHTGAMADRDSVGAATAIKSTVLGAAMRRYISPKWPLFIRGSGVVASWDCALNEAADADNGFRAKILDERLIALGVAFDVGGTYVWHNGVYLENTLVGASYFTVVSPPSRHVADLARRQIGSFRQWGLFNLALGYMF